MGWFSSLQHLGDVAKTAPANGDILVYSATTRLWELTNGTSYYNSWGAITGTITNQLDLINYLSSNYLALSQTSPQTVTGGKPNFSQGITFGTNPTTTSAVVGNMYWDNTYKTLDLNLTDGVNLQIGQEALIRVIAGEAIADGEAVYISSSSGIYPQVMKAIATSDTTARVKGIATQAIANGSQGFICNFGIVNGINTSGFSAGDLVYLSAGTAGALVNTQPIPPNLQVVVGRVVVANSATGSIYRSASPNYPISADQISMQNISGSPRHSLSDWLNTTSAGQIAGGTITDAGSQNITVASGYCLVATGTLDTDPITFCPWQALTNATVQDQRVTWVTLQYTGGTGSIVLLTGSSATDYSVPDSINYQNIFPLGYVTRNGTELYVSNNPRRMQDCLGGLSARFYQTLPLARDERLGGLILSESGTRGILVSAGKLWDRQNQFTINAFNSASGTSVFSTWYRGVVLGTFTETENVTAWPNTKYDNGSGTLQTVAANRYANLWWYLSTEGQIAMLYGRAIYTSAAAASAGAVPATLPLPVAAHYRLIARTTFQGSASTLTATDSAFSNTFAASAVSTHNNLGGLQGGVAGEYYHFTANEYTPLTSLATLSYASVAFVKMTGTNTFALDTSSYLTSVALTAPTNISVSGSPITGGTGTLALSWSTGGASRSFLGTPTTATGTIGLRTIVMGDLPTITTATFAVTAGTASYANALTFTVATATYAVTAGTSTYVTWLATSASRSFLATPTTATGTVGLRAIVMGDLPTITTATFAVTSGTASWSLNGATASYAVTAGTSTYVTWLVTSASRSFLATPTTATGTVGLRAIVLGDLPTISTATFAVTSGTSSWSLNGATASYAVSAGTATYVTWLATSASRSFLATPTSATGTVGLRVIALADLPTIATATFAVTSGTATYATNLTGTAATATYAVTSGTATYATNLTGVAATATFAVTAGTASYVSGTVATATFAVTSGTASYVSGTAATATFAVTAGTASWALNGATATFAVTSGTATYAISAGTASYATALAGAAANALKSSFGITIDGGGSVPATGSMGYIVLQASSTITNWYLVGDAEGSAVIDLKRSGTSIVGGSGNKPTLSTAQRTNATAGAWTSKVITPNDEIEFNLDSVATCKRLNLIIYTTRS